MLDIQMLNIIIVYSMLTFTCQKASLFLAPTRIPLPFSK